MIRHIVMWRVSDDTSNERLASRRLVKSSFEQLPGRRVPGMRHLEVSIDTSAVDHPCDVVLVTEFQLRQALDTYASDPEHLRVRQPLGSIRSTRFQVDYTVTATAGGIAEDPYVHA
jgi:hypothetical protein